MHSSTTLYISLLVVFAALPSIHVSAHPSRAHPGVAPQRPESRSGRQCNAPSSIKNSSATVTYSTSASAALVPESSSVTKICRTTRSGETNKTTHTSTTSTSAVPAHKTSTVATKTSTGKSSTSTSYYGGTNTGEGTYYNTGLDACGQTDSDSSSYIAAVSAELFDNYPGYSGSNPNNNPLCNKKAKASYNGKSVTVSITDRCTGCAATDLDFSPLAFEKLADLSVGRLSGVTWEWV